MWEPDDLFDIPATLNVHLDHTMHRVFHRQIVLQTSAFASGLVPRPSGQGLRLLAENQRPFRNIRARHRECLFREPQPRATMRPTEYSLHGRRS